MSNQRVGVALLTNDPNDDPYAVSAGTGSKLAIPGAGQLALPQAPVLTANGTLSASQFNQCNATGGSFTANLPATAGLIYGALVAVEKIDATANTVSIAGTIRGVVTTLVLQLSHETVFFFYEGSGSFRPLSDHKTLSSLDTRYVNLNSTDGAIPKQIRLSDTSLDLNRPWSDGATTWPGANPGEDITVRLQAAIYFLLGMAPGLTGPQFGVSMAAVANCEIYFSRPGTYIIGTTMQSGVSGGFAWQGVVLFPGIISGIGASIKIRGLSKPIWSSSFNQSGVIIKSACTGGEMFSCPAAGSGVYPSLSQICPQFENLTFWNSADGGVLDCYSSGAYHLIDCIEASGLPKGAGTRRAVTSPHNIQHGDMIIKNLWVVGGYKTALGVAEHLVAYGWHAIAGVQNVFESYGAGATVNIGGGCWITDCDTFLWSSASNGRVNVNCLIWESGGNTASRLVKDTFGSLTGKIGVHLTSTDPYPRLSLLGTCGRADGNNIGTGLDIEPIVSDAGGSYMKHPKDTFKRVMDAVEATDVPGLASDSWSPIFINQGSFTFTATHTSCTFTAGSATVLDPDITAADSGRTFFSANNPSNGIFVNTVVPGVSFKMSTQPIAQHDVLSTGPGTITGTLGVWSGNQPGQLRNANVGSISECYYPVKMGVSGGESRSVEVPFTLAAGTYSIQVPLNRVVGTNGAITNGTKITVAISAGKVTLSVPGSGLVDSSENGVVASGGSYVVVPRAEVGSDGLLKRVSVDLVTAGVVSQVCDHLLTQAERAAVGPGANFPNLQDGLVFSASDTGSYFTGFRVRPYAANDPVRRGAAGALTATGGVLSPATLDAAAATFFAVQVNDATATVLPAPINNPDPAMTQEITIELFNNTAGAIAVTLTTSGTPSFRLAGAAFTNPATNKRRSYTFRWNGLNWPLLYQTGDY